jgi:mRNA interferase RelE/StbE
LKREIQWDPVARAEIAELMRRDARTARRVYTAIRRFADENVGDVRKLTDQEGMHRLRVGDWRVLFSFEHGGGTVFVAHVLNRRDAYR